MHKVMLEQLIRSDKRNILLNSAYQGHVLKHLKKNMKNKGYFIKCLFDKEISISLSHCKFFNCFLCPGRKISKYVSVFFRTAFFHKAL